MPETASYLKISTDNLGAYERFTEEIRFLIKRYNQNYDFVLEDAVEDALDELDKELND